jgi:hypothetical protein
MFLLFLRNLLKNPKRIDRFQLYLQTANESIVTLICLSPATVLSVPLAMLLDSSNVPGMFRIWTYYALFIDGSLLIVWIINRELYQSLQRRKFILIRQLIAQMDEKRSSI